MGSEERPSEGGKDGVCAGQKGISGTGSLGIEFDPTEVPAEEEKDREEEDAKKKLEAAAAAARQAAEAAARMKQEYERALVDAEKAKEAFWTRMKLGQSKGTALFTIRTRQLSMDEEDATGLICDHPYAGFLLSLC